MDAGQHAGQQVTSNADLLSAIAFNCNLVDLARAAAVSKAWLAAVRTQTNSLRALHWVRAISGRNPELAQTGFYFHRHIVELPDGVLCVPDVNNRGLRLLSNAGAPLQLLQAMNVWEYGLQPRGPACDGTHVYMVDLAGKGCAKSLRPAIEASSSHTVFQLSSCWVGDDALLTPDACAVDGSTLYISDSGRDRVIVLDAGSFQRRGVLGGESGDGDGRFNRPQGLAARSGLLAVADAGNCRVQLFDGPAPSFLRSIGRSGDAPGCFTEPRGVGLVGARSGGLLLLVAESRRLQLLTLHGEPLQVLAPGPTPLRLGPPGLWGVALGSSDTRAYVVNTISNELHLLALNVPHLPPHHCAVDWNQTRTAARLLAVRPGS